MEIIPIHIKALIVTFLVAYMFSVGLETKRGEILEVLKERGLMGRVLLANLVLVPALGVLLVKLLNPGPNFSHGFLLVALAPGGLFALNFARVSKGNLKLAVGLAFGLSLLAVVSTPLLARLFLPVMGGASVPIVRPAIMLLLACLIPLFAGRAVQGRFPLAAQKLGKLLGVLSILLFILVAILTGKLKTPALLTIDAGGVSALVILVVASWALGWWLGGPEVADRKVLAISTSLRNVAVCLLIAASDGADPHLLPPVLAFSALSVPLNAVFGFLTKRVGRGREPVTAPVAGGSRHV